MTESWNNIRRRVRLVAMLQRQSATKEQMADAFGVHQRTINRDLAWLMNRGVPIEWVQASSISRAEWRIASTWDAAGWLWRLMVESE